MEKVLRDFKKRILKDRTIAVWGVGYLGYSILIRLQSKGFNTLVYDITNTGFKKNIKHGKYLSSEQLYTWSEAGSIPQLDLSKITAVSDANKMFSSPIQILAFPVADRRGNDLLKKTLDIFLDHKKELSGALAIFQSAGLPGKIETEFVGPLKQNKVACDMVSAFRSDWTIEEFLSNKRVRVLASDDPASLRKAMFFFDLLKVRYKTLGSITEAEIFENARNSLQFAAASFANQLAFGYPETNVRDMVNLLADDIELNESNLNIGSGSYKMLASMQNLVSGSSNPAALTILKEARDSNLSLILEYAELLKKKKCRSVTFLGITVKGNQKNIEASPAVILAEYLMRSGITVKIDDPFYDKSALTKILKDAKSTDLFSDKLTTDALIVMADHNKFRFITEKDLGPLGISKAKVIIDNVGLLKDLELSKGPLYHAIGDGNLGKF